MRLLETMNEQDPSRRWTLPYGAVALALCASAAACTGDLAGGGAPTYEEFAQAQLSKTSHEGWDNYLSDRNGRGVESGRNYNVSEQYVGRNGDLEVTNYTGRDRNGDGRLTRDEFSATGDGLSIRDRQVTTYDSGGGGSSLEAMQGWQRAGGEPAAEVVAIEMCYCFFPGNAPNPMRKPKSITVRTDQSGMDNLVSSWVGSAIAGRWSTYGFNRVKAIKLVDSEYPSLYNQKNNTIYISDKDRNGYGAVALDHELMLAGLHWAKMDKVISREEHERLVKLNVTRYGSLDGYIGTVRDLFDVEGVGAAKAFAVGAQYDKITRRDLITPYPYNGSNDFSYIFEDPRYYYRRDAAAAAKKFLALVDKNKFISKDQAGRAIRMLTSDHSNVQVETDRFVDDFTLDASPLRQELGAIQSKVPKESINLKRLFGSRADAAACRRKDQSSGKKYKMCGGLCTNIGPNTGNLLQCGDGLDSWADTGFEL